MLGFGSWLLVFCSWFLVLKTDNRQSGTENYPMGERFQAIIITDGLNKVYSLVQPFDTGRVQPVLILGSDSVFADDRLLKRSDFLIMPEAGKMILFVSLPELTVLKVVYHCLFFTRPAGEKKGGQLPRIRTDTGETLIVVTRVDTAALGSVDSVWRVSGSKSIGVSLGSEQGLGIDQATRLGFAGRVEDVEIEAELSDQSSPIPPEGTTLELEELDRMLINLRGRSWQGTFGDIALSADLGGFGMVSRRAMGAVITGGKGFISGSAGYAKPKGEFGRVQLTGIDGVQGPYLLAPDGRSAEIVPKSEVVYLDGRHMTRGWDADYTVDYSTGEIYFTNRHIITSQSRIEAFFQFVTFDYERTGICTGLKIEPGPFHFGLSLFQERDNPERMLSEELTEEQKRLLAAAGADTNGAWLPGGELVGPGKGDYILEEGHYRFVGPNAGSYRVRFTLKGDSLGAYVYDDTLLGFRYVGSGAGNYVDSFRVSLPKQDEVAYGSTGFSFQGLVGYCEGVFRRRNLNLFAKEGSGFNAGGLGFGFNWERTNLALSFRHQGKQENFVLPGSINEIDFSYHWAGTKPEQVGFIDEMVMRAKPFQPIELQLELGRLKRYDRTALNRLGGLLQANWASFSGFKAGQFSLLRTEIAPRIFWFYPRAGWQQEVNGQELNRTYRAGGEVKPIAGLSLDLDMQLTNFEAKESVTGGWQQTGKTRIVQLKLNQEFREMLQLSGNAGFQDRSYTETGQDNWRRFFGTISAGITPISGLRITTNMSQSYRQVQLRDELFRYVGPGKGSYRRDSIYGGYVYDPDGDYERVVVYLGRFAAAKDLLLNGSVSLTGLEPVQILGSFEHNLTAADTGILNQTGAFDFRLELNRSEFAVKPSVGATGDFSIDRTLRITGRQVSRNQEFIELESEGIRGVKLQVRINRSDVNRRLVSGEIEYQERGWLFSLNPVIGTWLRLEPGLGLQLKQIAEPKAYPELGQFYLHSTEGFLARNWLFGGKTRLRTRAGITYRWSNINYLPDDVELTQPLGWVPEGAIELEHLFSDIFSLSSVYRFTDRPGKPAQHQFSLQLRAFF
jgi:hypothetical protein